LHQITPKTFYKPIPDDLRTIYGILSDVELPAPTSLVSAFADNTIEQLEKLIKAEQKSMEKHVKSMAFELAAEARDKIAQLKALILAKTKD
jgi:excinuclease UvrABC helicase subunit UvrB